jgi:rod shape-determining protein MreC
MEYSPPPLFKQGPSALARLIFFVVLALALLISDARFNTLEIVRGVLGAGLYPLQRAALVPRDIFMGATDLAITSATLRSENQKLADKNLQLSIKAGDAEQLSIENTHLRALLQLQSRATTQTTPAEVQYDTRDPFTQKVVIG